VKPGDMIRYRDRKETDPHPSDVGEMGRWGTTGIIVRLLDARYVPEGKVLPSIEYIDDVGDWVVCKQSDVEVISSTDYISMNRSS